ncbi:MAG: (Fe-S)-binding protein, partial [Oceanospirillales bacterium]|nr:(Fe-S)-binding protein [Oceanospirillales bacterium]
MWELKQLLDPQQILNPGVILNRDAEVHLSNLKPMPAADPLVDTCIECGFCEPTCPSRALTLTPRQRIVIWREIARLERSGEDPQRLSRLRKDYGYQGDETCAACGLCSTACPVGINTGDLTRSIRHDRNKRHASTANWIARHYAGVTSTSRTVLKLADSAHALLGRRNMESLTQGLRKLSGNRVQQWTPSMPTAAPRIRQPKSITTDTSTGDPRPKVVYLPSCASRMMGPQRGSSCSHSLAETTHALLTKAGFEVIYPLALDSLCCGMPFQSKGMFDAADMKSSELNQELLRITERGQIPVYSDTSPCTLRLKEKIDPAINLYDSIDFLDRFVVDKLQLTPVAEPIALHITCSATRLGQSDALKRIAALCASEVVIPEDISCCGFAGDKGFSTPELNASALRHLKRRVDKCAEGFSSSRTCEIGLSHHSGIEYKSIIYLLERCASRRT